LACIKVSEKLLESGSLDWIALEADAKEFGVGDSFTAANKLDIFENLVNFFIGEGIASIAHDSLEVTLGDLSIGAFIKQFELLFGSAKLSFAQVIDQFFVDIVEDDVLGLVIYEVPAEEGVDVALTLYCFRKALLEPIMVESIFEGDPSIRVSHQEFVNEVPGLSGCILPSQESGLIGSFSDLLEDVFFGGLFKR